MKKEVIDLFKELDIIKKQIANDKLRNNPEFIRIRNKIAEKNLKLVISRVLSICKSMDEDIIEAGNEGLIIAIEKFDISIGTEFSTYAVPWIDQFIYREMSKLSNWSSIPLHKLERIKKALKDLEEKLQREPNIAEISQETEISEQEVWQMLNAIQTPISLNYQPPESDTELNEIIACQSTSIQEQVEASLIGNELLNLLKAELNQTEIKVITLRYGLLDERNRSLEEIASMMGVTRERIRQIELKALRKLRKSKKIGQFLVYMDNPERCKDKIKKGFF